MRGNNKVREAILVLLFTVSAACFGTDMTSSWRKRRVLASTVATTHMVTETPEEDLVNMQDGMDAP